MFNLVITVISAVFGRTKSIYENRILPIFKHNVSKEEFIEAYTDSMCVIDNKTDRQLLSAVKYKDTDFIPATDKQGNIYYVDGKTVTKRCAENVETWYMLPLDLDEDLTIQSAEKLYKNHEYVLSTSFNHTAEHHKFHIFMFLKEPVSAADFDARTDAIKEFIGGADLSSISKSQGFFLPSCSDENKEVTQIFHSKGEPLDLMSFPVNKPKPVEPTKKPAKRDIEVNITSLTNAARDYLKDFIWENLWQQGHHKQIMPMACTLKHFNYPVQEAIELLRGYKSSNSNACINGCYAGAKAEYGHMGVFINLLKHHGVYKGFDVQKFNRLAGIVKLSTIKGELLVNELKVTEELVLRKESYVKGIKVELDGMLTFEERDIPDKLSKILTDSDFPLGITVLKSPTGSGKTHLFAYGLTGKRIMVVPTKVLADQVAKHQGIVKCYGKDKFPIGAEVIVMTYDKLSQFIELIKERKIDKQDYSLFVDEAHNLITSYTFRKDAMNVVYDVIMDKYFSRVALMSGTLNLNLLPKLPISKLINVTRAEPTIQICKIIKTDDYQRFIQELAKNKGKIIALINDKKVAKKLAAYFNKLSRPQEIDGVLYPAELNILTQVFTADNQKDWVNQKMISDESINPETKLIIMTQIGVEGLNLNNTDIHHVIAVGHHDTTTLEQFVNRARKVKPTLYVTRSLTAKDDGFLSQLDIKTSLADAQTCADFNNNIIGRLNGEDKVKAIKQFSTSLTHMPAFLGNTVRYNKRSKQFDVSYLGLAAAVHEMDGRNESYNAELFDLHMAEYNFVVTRETVTYEGDNLSKKVHILACEEQAKEDKANQALFKNAISTHKVTTPQGLKKLANEVEGRIHTDLAPLADVFIKSDILSNHYAVDDVIDLMGKHIKDKKVFSHAMEYADQVKYGCSYRAYFESSIKLQQWYTGNQLDEIVKLVNDQLYNQHRVKLDKMKKPKARTAAFQHLFAMQKKRERVNGKVNKDTFYQFTSYNPIGKELITLPKGEADIPATLPFKGQPLIPEGMTLNI